MTTSETQPSVLLSTAYLPPVSYCSVIFQSGNIVFEKHEHYIKQTYRNRTLIAGAEKIHALVVPVSHEQLYQKPVHEVRISYDSPWQRNHWRAIESSYRNSPYFEFMEDDFRELYLKPVETLFGWNLKLLEKVFRILKVPFTPQFTGLYEKDPGAAVTDLRNSFHPSDRKTGLKHYTQVFSDRQGFLPDLCILDLLFNKGPGAVGYMAGNTA